MPYTTSGKEYSDDLDSPVKTSTQKRINMEVVLETGQTARATIYPSGLAQLNIKGAYIPGIVRLRMFKHTRTQDRQSILNYVRERAPTRHMPKRI